MRGSDRDLWSHADWGAGSVSPTNTGSGGGWISDALRACCTPANLAVALMAALGWAALLGWSGSGPDGWQARLCAGLDVQPQSCSVVRMRGDGARIAPHAVTVGATS